MKKSSVLCSIRAAVHYEICHSTGHKAIVAGPVATLSDVNHMSVVIGKIAATNCAEGADQREFVNAPFGQIVQRTDVDIGSVMLGEGGHVQFEELYDGRR